MGACPPLEAKLPRFVDQGKTKIYWVPGDTGITNVAAPTVAQLNAGVDITCLLLSTYEVMADASDTTNERAVCETANVVAPTIQNYKGNLILFRQYDDITGVPESDDTLAIFVFGAVGWFVRRIGKPYTTAWATGDKVDVYKFMIDTPQIAGGTGEGYLKGTVPLLQQGTFNINATVA
jgi:hypothetical protein